MRGDSAISWADVDTAMKAAFSKAAQSGGEVVFLTESINSPSTLKAGIALENAYPGAKFTHIEYDARSFEGMRVANKATFGKSMIPYLDFSKAKVIVSVAADFMNDFPLSAQYTKSYGSRRKPDGPFMSRHFQFEAAMSLTGSNADYRTPILPSDEGKVLASIYQQVTGRGSANAMADLTSKASADLKAARGAAMVVAGSNDPNVQMIANAINVAIGAVGTTVMTDTPVNMFKGERGQFERLISRMNSGSVKTLVMHGVNPAYDSPMASEFLSALAKVETSACFSMHADETASKCSMMLPVHHALETWNDFNVVGSTFALSQPTIQPITDSRQYQDCVLNWAGYNGTFIDFLENNWKTDLANRQTKYGVSDFWNYSLHNGSVELSRGVVAALLTDDAAEAQETVVSTPSTDISGALAKVNATATSGKEVFLYTKVGIGTGRHATNPWLQELPDPITKICWDNYATMSPADVDANGYNMTLGQESPATLVDVTVGGKKVTLPVVPVPGQKSGTVGIALGYGRGANGENIGRAAFQVKEYGGYELDENGGMKPLGANAYPLVASIDGVDSYYATGAEVTATGATYKMAATQTHHTVMERTSVVKETNLATYKTGDVMAYNKPNTLTMHEGGKQIQKPVSEVDLWDKHPIEDIGHWWGLSIDLSSCLGCGSCITACHSENNVPVVGKDEVRRSRDMHWMRIDRYFTSDMTKARAKEEGVGTIDMYGQMEVPADKPQVVHMPMMCQHCNHAPCETVCPVAATTHSSEGLNQMTYNRCIGTRYCANNCPYKVRRFNWFNYKAYSKFTEVNPSQDWVGRMVLNPDVTVRSRGVMEKCSMCVQRIQAGKLDAKLNGTPVPDGSVKSACQEACPADCITFGDMNDKNSKISKRKADSRTYLALEEVGTQPSISYMVKVRNTDDNQA